MDKAAVISTLLSIPFIMALVGVIRKLWPAINGGKATLITALACTVVGNALGYLATTSLVPAAGWYIVGSVVAAVMAMGIYVGVDRGIDRFAGKLKDVVGLGDGGDPDKTPVDGPKP